jgi:CSLREA domain-containing protein
MAYRTSLLLVAACFLSVGDPWVASSQAATITVNSAADVLDGADGQCTLREAVLAANDNVASGAASGECVAGEAAVTDEIRFVDLPGSPDVYTLAIPADALNDAHTGDLNITESVSIHGNGETKTVIDGGRRDRIFRIGPAFLQVHITDVTIRHGIEQLGGGVANFGSSLMLTHVSLIANSVECSASGCTVMGGGVLNDGGTVTVALSTIALNTATCSRACAGAGVANLAGGRIDFVDSFVESNVVACDSPHSCTASGGGIWSDGIVNVSQTLVRSTNVARCLQDTCTAQGAGLFVHGGIATLAAGTVVTANRVICSGRNCQSLGGGLARDAGEIRVIASSVLDNRALATCPTTPPCHARGGGIAISGASSSLPVLGIFEGSAVSSNEATCVETVDECAAQGGGLFNEAGVAGANRSTFSDNVARGERGSEGGGIFNHAFLGLTATTLATNVAHGPDDTAGGGVANKGSMTVWNSTFSTNVAQCETMGCSSRGGGVFNGFIADFNFATFYALNTAGCTTSPCMLAGGGIYTGPAGTTRIKNSIVADSIVQDCFNDGGAFQAVGTNLDGDATCPGFSLAGVNPLLGFLAFNGGLTATHALAPASAAVDAASDCLDLGLVIVQQDQRGIFRPKGPACDLGAYERTAFNLGASLKHVLEFLSDTNRANNAAACGKLRAFMHQLRGHERRGELTREEVVGLAEGAERLAAGARCPAR